MTDTARNRHQQLARCALVPAAALILIGGAAGCGAGSTTSSGVTPGATVASTASSSAPSTASASLLTAAQLQSALLTAGELGPAFAASNSASGSTGTGASSVTGCEPLASLLNGSAGTTQQVQQDVLLTAGSTGPFVQESLLTESPVALAADYAQARAALTSCHTLTFPTGAEPLTFTLSPIDFGGPGSAAARMDATYRGVEVNGYIAIDRLGTVALTYAYFQIGSGSSQLASAYYRQAVDKINQVLGSASTAQSSN